MLLRPPIIPITYQSPTSLAIISIIYIPTNTITTSPHTLQAHPLYLLTRHHITFTFNNRQARQLFTIKLHLRIMPAAQQVSLVHECVVAFNVLLFNVDSSFFFKLQTQKDPEIFKFWNRARLGWFQESFPERAFTIDENFQELPFRELFKNFERAFRSKKCFEMFNVISNFV